MVLSLGALLEGVGLPYPVGIQLALLGYWKCNTTQSFMKFWLLFIGANSVGGALAYFIGRQFWHRGILKNFIRFFPLKATSWRRAKKYIRVYGAYSIFGAYMFSRTMRTLIMYIAGATDTPFYKYFFCVVAGNSIWGGAWLGLGVVWANNKEKYFKLIVMYKTAVIAIAVLTASILVYLYLSRLIFLRRSCN